MRIILDGTPVMMADAGLGRYTRQLVRALGALETGDEVLVSGVDPLGRLVRLGSNEGGGAPAGLRQSSTLSRTAAFALGYCRVVGEDLLGRTDVFHVTAHRLPLVLRQRVVVTLYDLSFLLFPQTHVAANRLFLRLVMPGLLRRADAVICISRHTSADAEKYYRLDARKIAVIPLGVDCRFRPVRDPASVGRVRARYGLPERYVLYVGAIEPRKNLITLLAALEKLWATAAVPHALVIAGGQRWKAGALHAALSRSPHKDKVLLPGHIADGDLPAVYSAAELFTYPSLYEGFGLPPLEAMACGTPVVCSNRAALPEVVGDAGVLVDGADSDQLAEAIHDLLSDRSRREEFALKGERRARLFRWEETAKETMAIYRRIVDR